MAARPLSTGTISFGLVTVPVKLYSAAESASGVSFNMLHEKCKTRLKQQYICPQCNEVVTRDQTVRGYEFAKEQYVAFTEEELKAMAEQNSPAIEITEFVPLSKVDPIYFDSAYYLGPDKGGDRAYTLLAAAMRETQRCALAKWNARGKGYLVLVRPCRRASSCRRCSTPTRCARSTRCPGRRAAEGRGAQAGGAARRPDLVRRVPAEQYEDEVRKRYHEAIQRKVEGQEVTAAPPSSRARRSST
jgi:DNA end-binding protein Ku